jgi:hypothetical protein
MSEEPRPEAQHPEEALLWRTWARDLPDEEVDVPEEVLALLDGSADAATSARAREAIAADPRLARAVGGLVEELRHVAGPQATGSEAGVPAALRESVIAAGTPPPPAARDGHSSRRGWFRELFASPTPALVAAAAAVLLVAVVLRSPAPPGPPALRSDEALAAGPELVLPAAGATVQGDIVFTWEPVRDARRYRVVLLDVAGGDVEELDATASTRLVVEGEELARRLGPEPRELHWIVRARRGDGTVSSSAPGRFRWSASER